MKHLLIGFFAILCLISCDRNENSLTKVSGEWKLQNVKYPQSNKTIYYLNQNIIYNFQLNNILKVSGGANDGYTDGEYSYLVKTDYLSDNANPDQEKIELVVIDGSKWTYSVLKNELKLDQSYIDGPILTFVKK